MIEIEGKYYYSPYNPADKNFFYLLEKTNFLLSKSSEDVEDHMKMWELKYDLKTKLNEALDIKEEHKELSKELNLVINQCEYELLQFDDFTKEAFIELENYLQHI